MENLSCQSVHSRLSSGILASLDPSLCNKDTKPLPASMVLCASLGSPQYCFIKVLVTLMLISFKIQM